MGAMGHMLIKTIHAHWPDYFKFQHKPPPGNGSNHDVASDLFLDNYSALSLAQQEKLYLLAGKPGLVLAHNVLLVPPHILEQATVCDIKCDDLAQATALFLGWCKWSHARLEYINQFNKDLDIYQAEFLQMLKTVNIHTNIDGDINIDFWDLNNIRSLAPLLDCVKKEFSLGEYHLQTDWFNNNYTRSIGHLKSSDEYIGFCTAFIKAKKQSVLDFSKNYKDFYTVEEADNFRKSIDFIHRLHYDRLILKQKS